MGKTVKACISLFSIRVSESFQYRIAALSGAITSLIWAIIEIAVLMAFYRFAERAGFAGGLTMEQAVSFVWVRELLLFMMPYSIDNDLLDKISNGNVALDMCRPIDLYWHWFACLSAGKIVIFVMRCLVCFAIGFLIPGGYGARPPVSLPAFSLFLPSVLCAFLLCSAYGMLVTAVRINISWGNGPMYLMLLLAQVLCGGYLPLQLWPDSIQPFLLLQPFAGLIDIPARLYVGSMALSDAWFGMAVQFFWALVFIGAGRLVMTQRLRTIVVQGG